MSKKLKIGVIFGGKSAEHEVSLQSAENIINSLDKNKYEIVSIKISKAGEFNFDALKKTDVIFPVLHGPFGEDGIMQGVFREMGKPFVGAGVLGSAVGMDKDVMKRLLLQAGIPIGKFVVMHSHEKVNFTKIKKQLGLPMFVKPANMGSSVGVSKVKNETDFKKAISQAFLFDRKIIIEEFIDGRELECAVLGNEFPMASVPGEIIPGQEFYSYDAKYLDSTSVCQIPAKIDKKTSKKIQELAIKTFQVLNCEGLGRVDFFLKKNPKGNTGVLVNEINTLPGFTNISMYPKLWEASGLPQTKLLDRLIELAIERFQKESQLKTSLK